MVGVAGVGVDVPVDEEEGWGMESDDDGIAGAGVFCKPSSSRDFCLSCSGVGADEGILSLSFTGIGRAMKSSEGLNAGTEVSGTSRPWSLIVGVLLVIGVLTVSVKDKLTGSGISLSATIAGGVREMAGGVGRGRGEEMGGTESNSSTSWGLTEGSGMVKADGGEVENVLE